MYQWAFAAAVFVLLTLTVVTAKSMNLSSSI